jgi:hypothetical protein
VASQAEEGYCGLPAGIGKNLRFAKEIRKVKDRTVNTDGCGTGAFVLRDWESKMGKAKSKKPKFEKIRKSERANRVVLWIIV